MNTREINQIIAAEKNDGYLADQNSFGWRVGIRRGEKPGCAIANSDGELATECWVSVSESGIRVSGPGYMGGHICRTCDEARLIILRDAVNHAVMRGRNVYHKTWEARVYEALAEAACDKTPSVRLHTMGVGCRLEPTFRLEPDGWTGTSYDIPLANHFAKWRESSDLAPRPTGVLANLLAEWKD